jgi:predicted nucleotidyltransferase
MTVISVPSLRSLEPRKAAALLRVAEAARGGHSQPMLVGAFARDVWFWHVHGIETARATENIDISMEFPDWNGFARFGEVLRGMGFTQPVSDHPEKLLDPQTGQKLDLLPFCRLSTDGRGSADARLPGP